MFSFIAGKYRIAGFIAAIAAIPLLYGAGYWRGYAAGKSRARIETVEKVIKIREAQNEIRNHRPDDRQLVDILRKGEF